MKKFSYFLFAIATALMLFSSCKKDGTTDTTLDRDPEVKNSLSDETLNSIEVDLGEVGLAIDTRQLAVLGYKPAKVNVQINGDLSAYSQNDITVDEFTNLAMFKFAIKDLSDAVISGLGNGVNITVTVFDAGGVELESTTESNAFVDSNNRSLTVETTKPSLLDARAFNPGISYYMIVLSGPGGTDVAESNSSIIGGYTYDQTNGDALEFSNKGNLGLTVWEENETSIYAQSQKFYFEDLGGNVYNIRSEFEGAYLEVDIDGNDYRLFWNKQMTDPSLLDDSHKFILESTTDGFVRIQSFNGDYLVFDERTREITTDQDVIPYNASDPSSYYLTFRFLTTGVTWEYTPQDTKYSAPIIPPTSMQFGAAVTIINCSDGTQVNQTFGTTETETEQFTTTTSESVSLFGNNTFGWSASISASASVSFFGTGVDVTATGTVSGERQSGFENEYATTSTITTGETKEFSQATTVSVNPNTAIELYNVTQIVSDVTMPFVTRIKIEGEQNGVALTGAQIVSQLIASRFPGVVTRVLSDNVVVSIRGTISVDKYFETTSNIKDIEGACN